MKEKDKGRKYDVDDDHIVGFLNGGAVRAAINKGDVSKKDIFSAFPFQDTVYGLYVSGHDLLEVLEASTQVTPEPDGGFPQVSGIDYTIETGLKYCKRSECYPGTTIYGPEKIVRVTINNVNGKPFSVDDTYLVFTNKYCADGGNACYLFSQVEPEKKFDTSVSDADSLITYMTEDLKGVIGTDYAEPKGLIKVLVPSVEVSDCKAVYNGVTPELQPRSLR